MAPEAYYYWGGGETHGFSSVREHMHFVFILDKILLGGDAPIQIIGGRWPPAPRFRRLWGDRGQCWVLPYLCRAPIAPLGGEPPPAPSPGLSTFPVKDYMERVALFGIFTCRLHLCPRPSALK